MKNYLLKLSFIATLIFNIAVLPANICTADDSTEADVKITLSATKDGGGVFYPNQSVNDLLLTAKTNDITLRYDSKTSTYATDDSGFSAVVSGGIVTEIYNSKFGTADGLSIGDSVDAVTKIYGKPVSYQINDAEMYLYDIDGVYMEILSTNLGYPDATPPVILEIRYLPLGNSSLADFFGVYMDDADTYSPLGNGTSFINNGQYLYYVYADVNALYRINKQTDEKELLSHSCISDIAIYARRLYYTALDSFGNSIVCNMALDGTDVQTLLRGHLAYLNDNMGRIYYTVQDGDRINLMKADMQGHDPALIRADISNFISGSVYGGVLFDTVANGTLALHYINPQTSEDTIIAEFPTADGDTSYTTIENAEVFRNNVYYTVGSHQGSGSYWYGDLYSSDADGSATKCPAKDTAEKFYIYGKDLYYTQDQYKDVEKNAAIDLISGQTKPANQSVFNVYDGDRRVYFDNSSESKLILGSKIFNADSSVINDVVSLDRTTNPNITQNIGSILVSGNWICFQVRNVDYNNMRFGWRGVSLPSQYYIVKKDGTGLQLLNTQKDLDDAINRMDNASFYAKPFYDEYSDAFDYAGYDITFGASTPEHYAVPFRYKNNSVLLMVNGVYSDVMPTVINGVSYLSTDDIVNVFGVTVNTESAVTIEDTTHLLTFEFTVGSDIAKMNGKIVSMSGKVFLNPKDEKIYLPLRTIAESYGYECSYSGNFNYFPTIAIDKSTTSGTISQDAAKKNTQTALNQALDKFITAFNKNPDEALKSEAPLSYDSQSVKLIKEDIDELKYVGIFSKYYIFEGPYLVLVDRYTGNIYLTMNNAVCVRSQNLDAADFSSLFIPNFLAG